MSNIAITPNSSGTGTISITAPNTNTNRTIALPDVAGNVVTTGDTGTVATGMVADNAVTNVKISDVSTSKLGYIAGNFIQRVSTQKMTYHPGSGDSISWDSSGNIVETIAYNNAALQPLISLSITAKKANSKFIITMDGRFNISTGTRSQIALHDTYTSGGYNKNQSLYYSHYGLYNATGGNMYTNGSVSLEDTRSLAAGVARTYYWFGGSIGGGTQTYSNLSMSITEVST